MTIGSALRTHLLGDTAISALVVARVYPLRLPQKPLMPAIVYMKVTGRRFTHLRGPASLARPRYQLDCWASTHDGAVELGTLVRQRLDGYNGTWSDGGSPAITMDVSALLDPEQGDRDLFEEDVNGGLCRNSADYFIFHSTAGGSL